MNIQFRMLFTLWAALMLSATVKGQFVYPYFEYSTNNENFYYITNDNDQAIIEGGTGTNCIVIPGSLNGLPVEGIQAGTFAANSSSLPITSVIVTNAGISIGNWAFFHCSTLTNIVLGAGITNIGFNAFSRCSNLDQIYIDPNNPAFVCVGGVLFNSNQTTLIQCLVEPAGSYTVPPTVTNIGPWAFSRCGLLANVTIPSGAISIGSNAFDFCTSMANVELPDSVTSVGASAFAMCTSLTNAMLGTGLASLGSYAFILCTNLASINIPDSVTNIGNDAFDFCTALTNISFGGGISGIAPSTFWSCTGLLNVSIPNSVTNLGNDAFWSCTGLTNISIGSGLTGMGTNAMYWCLNLGGINVNPANPAYNSINGVLFDKGKTLLIQYPNGLAGDYAIPGGILNIGSYAFSDSGFLTTVTVPGTVTNIGISAFEDCSSLSGVYFYGNAPTVDATSFNYDTNVFVYYLPGASGWKTTYDGLPVAPWSFQAQGATGGLGLGANQFGFSITGSSNLEVVVEGCTNMASPSWQPIQTNTLAGGSFNFTDAQWTNYSAWFYRLRSP